MSSVNKVILVGNVGKDPEARSLQNGGEVVSFSVATSETWTRDGQKQERTEWSSVVVFNEHIAKVVKQYVKKGSKVYLEGQLQTRKWQDQNGNDRYSTEVVLQRFKGELVLLSSKASESEGNEQRFAGDAGNSRPASRQAGSSPSVRDANPFDADLSDDVPF